MVPDPEVDNRDLTTTWLHATVEVNPWELVENAIQNAVEEPAEYIARLDHLRRDIERKTEVEW